MNEHDQGFSWVANAPAYGLDSNKIIENFVEQTLAFEKWGTFFNAQQILAQLATHIILSIPLYHAFRTFKFINTFPL